MQDHNYGAPPPLTPPQSPRPSQPPVTQNASKVSSSPPSHLPPHNLHNGHLIDIENVSSTVVVSSGTDVRADDASNVSLGKLESVDDSVTRCICDFQHDDGYMIQCDRCRYVTSHTALLSTVLLML